MLIKTPVLLLILLFLASGLQYSLGYEVAREETERLRCVQRCQETEQDLPGLVECTGRCQSKYRGSEREETKRDPKSPWAEIQRCQQDCSREETDRRELQKCQQRCEEEVIKRRQEEQQREQERHSREGGDGIESHREDPRQHYERCRLRCEKKGGRQKQQCQSWCDKEYEERQKEWEREHEHGRGRGNDEYRETTNNPYYFHAQRLQSRFRTEEGHIRVLEKFSKRSELLRGIENYRLSLMEANPNTFVVPHHSDAEILVVVLNGKGTINYVLRDKRESNNLETGDVMKIPAGATVYMINHDNTEKLSLAKLIMPVNVPGKFREYFVAGGENPETLYTVFSNEVLEAALDTPRDQLDRLFGQQNQGVILKAPQQQLKAISQRVSSSKHKGKGVFNLLNEKPLYSNRYGNFMEASPNDKKQLEDIDVSVAFCEIKRGSLMVPHYNSKTTAIVLVVEGTGRMEMASPHLTSQTQKESEEIRRGQESVQETRRGTSTTQRYQKISSNLSPGDVFIIPAGHPVALLSSQNENLRTLGFGINAWNNERNFLAGQKDNVMNQIEKEAKELSFNAPAELIEKIFRNQKESHFVAQQGQRQREEGIPSILDFTGFF